MEYGLLASWLLAAASELEQQCVVHVEEPGQDVLTLLSKSI